MASAPDRIPHYPLVTDRLERLQSLVADYDREQLLWSSGYLAGLAAAGSPASLAAPPQDNATAAKLTWSVFFATETGNSRRVAEALAEKARANGLQVDLHDLRDYRPRSLAKVTHALFVVATHGNGEAPDGAELFFEYWLADTAPRLEQLNYSVLALGDSSYVDFCEIGRVLDERLQQLGATALVSRADCDLDFDLPAAAWTDDVLASATELAGAVEVARPTHLRPVDARPGYSRSQPFPAEILVNQRITGNGSTKEVRHYELNLDGSGLEYQPGDALGIIPQNPPELIERLLEATGLDGSQQVTIDVQPLTLARALQGNREITVLSRPFLQSVAAHNAGLQEIIDDRDKLTAYFKTRQVIDVVSDYARPWQAQEFVDALRKLTPRLYSIASSPDANPDEVHLTVAVVKYAEFGRQHWGAASNFLNSGASAVPVYIEPNEHFRLPSDPATPIIMIGAGTGVAPYRAFIEHRREHGQPGDNWLIFGDRNRVSDFLYQREWLRYRGDGSLQRLDVAFSRDQQRKVYVQHRILEQSRSLYAWLQRGAHVYVCGDADYMANDVHEALLTVVRDEGGLSADAATAYLAELKAAHRYQRDVY